MHKTERYDADIIGDPNKKNYDQWKSKFCFFIHIILKIKRLNLQIFKGISCIWKNILEMVTMTQCLLKQLCLKVKKELFST
jgi:hypothetical protein